MQLESVSYHIKKKWILKNISFKLKAGEVMFLLGRNGSGKTTLLNLMAGIWTPQKGKIHPCKSFFYLPTSPYLNDDLLVADVYDILECEQGLVTQNEKLLQIQHLKGLPISQISSGEYKRVWLVAILSHYGEAFLLDEPLSHLDWPFQKILQEIIIKMSDKGQSFLITTHNFNWALGFTRAFGGILPPPLQKYPLKELFQSKTFQKSFQCSSEIVDNPLNGSEMLALSHQASDV